MKYNKRSPITIFVEFYGKFAIFPLKMAAVMKILKISKIASVNFFYNILLNILAKNQLPSSISWGVDTRVATHTGMYLRGKCHFFCHVLEFHNFKFSKFSSTMVKDSFSMNFRLFSAISEGQIYIFSLIMMVKDFNYLIWILGYFQPLQKDNFKIFFNHGEGFQLIWILGYFKPFQKDIFQNFLQPWWTI